MKQTLRNLASAFIGESMARNRYSFYASAARKEGFEQIAEIFTLTADNEREHASWLNKLMNQLDKNAKPVVEVEVPITRGSTQENLRAAIEGEHHEFTKMYPEYANIAEKEGLKEIAQRLRAIAKAEEHHHERFTKLLKQVEAGTVFKKEKEVWWVCRECGYAFYGKNAPEKCPSCDHAKAFYQLKCEEY